MIKRVHILLLAITFSLIVFVKLGVSAPSESKNDGKNLQAEKYIKTAESFIKTDIDSALFYASKAFNCLRTDGNIESSANYNLLMADIYKQKSLYDVSLKYYHTALSIYKQGGIDHGQSAALTGIGDIYDFQKQDSLALKYYFESLSIAERIGSQHQKAQNFNNIAVVFKRTNSNLSISYFNKAIEIYLQLDMQDNLGVCYNNLGTLHRNLNNIDSAEVYMIKSMRIRESTGNLQGFAISLNNLAYLNYEKALSTEDLVQSNFYYNTAIEYAKKSLEVSKNLNSLYTRSNSYGTLTQIYLELENYEEAMNYQSLYFVTRDSIFNIDKAAVIEDIEAKYQVSRKNAEIIALESEKELSKIRNAQFYTIVFGIVSLLSIFLTLLIIKRRKDKMIYSQKEQILLNQEKLTNSELEKKRLKEKELLSEIDFKSKQLNTHALNMIQKNTILNDVKTEIKNIYSDIPEKYRKSLQRIINKISFAQNSEKDWEKFKLYFEQINKDFYDKLKKINSDLSDNDLRICALIKLNLSPKEIAKVLNIAPNSIKSSRYRLKKKLALDTKDDLEMFVRGI
ncbi:MAG: tetratricopeptide repeat protein [Bacteroidales bacterium]|nr:tetratricopeptide repeat protein [Bacteroidales bacterium]